MSGSGPEKPPWYKPVASHSPWIQAPDGSWHQRRGMSFGAQALVALVVAAIAVAAIVAAIYNGKHPGALW